MLYVLAVSAPHVQAGMWMWMWMPAVTVVAKPECWVLLPWVHVQVLSPHHGPC